FGVRCYPQPSTLNPHPSTFIEELLPNQPPSLTMPSPKSMAEQRKLVTIMAVDVAGYSRASEKDDSAMAAAVGRLRSVIADAIAPHGGRVFNTAGDGFMIEVSSAISAVAAAQALLAAIAEQDLPAVRIGLHLGDVILSAN